MTISFLWTKIFVVFADELPKSLYSSHVSIFSASIVQNLYKFWMHKGISQPQFFFFFFRETIFHLTLSSLNISAISRKNSTWAAHSAKNKHTHTTLRICNWVLRQVAKKKFLRHTQIVKKCTFTTKILRNNTLCRVRLLHRRIEHLWSHLKTTSMKIV